MLAVVFDNSYIPPHPSSRHISIFQWTFIFFKGAQPRPLHRRGAHDPLLQGFSIKVAQSGNMNLPAEVHTKIICASCSLLECRQPSWCNISRTTAFSGLHQNPYVLASPHEGGRITLAGK